MPEEHSANLPQAGPSPGKAHILLVDDEPANLLALEAILDEPQYELVKARSGEEALRQFETGEFAVVLLDVRMAGMDGFETAKRLRQRERFGHTPIIFLTAYEHDRSVIEREYALGAVDFLIKPLVPIVLCAKVSGLVELFQEKQRALRQTEQIRLLIEGTTDFAIFMLDARGCVATWNPGAQRITGYLPKEIIGRHFSACYTQEAIDKRWPEHELEIAQSVGRFEDEGWRVRKDGSRYWANVVISALRNPGGHLLGFLNITRDLSERRRAEESLQKAHSELETRVKERTAELARANAELREADARKDAFLAMLAHELRNPLAPVRNALQILKMPNISPELNRQVREMMERQVQHLVRLVDDLLDVARVMQGKIDLHLERVDLSTVFARAVETAQPFIDGQGHELAVSLPPQPLHVEADVVRLAQAISNLLTNAAKYTDQGGRIWLSGERADQEAVIRVRDTGVGIEPEVLPRIFDLFVQADRSLERSQGGLGIGLTLVKRLVELHSGRVEAHSPGLRQGSEFVVRMPALAYVPSEEDSPRAPLPVAGPSRRVLVVDDNVDAADSAAMLLRFLGHEVEVAYDGHVALEAVRDFRPDIVLLDIGLPGLSGYDVARRLRALPECQGIVLAAVTGYGQEEDRRRSREAGFDFHLTKPLAPEALTAFVASPGSL